MAAQINVTSPGWYVLWGVATRRLWAFPTWHGAPAGLLLDDTDPNRLLAAMRRVELGHGQAPVTEVLRGGAQLPPTPPRRVHSSTTGRDGHGQFAGD